MANMVPHLPVLTVISTLRTVGEEFADDFVAALPALLSGLVFLTLAFFVIRIVQWVLRSVLEGIYPRDEQLIVDLVVIVVRLLLWFAAGLALLNIVGMQELAASLGTATGFIALGIALALKDMIADTVAGFYLLQDPDFNEGDTVETASVSGDIVTIDLRKTRIREEDGDLVVVANRDVEKRWTQIPDETAT